VTNRYGIVLVLVVASFVIQIAAPDDDLTRLVIVWLQAITLVFTIRIAQASRRIVRLGAALATLVAVAAPVLWAVHGSIPVGASATTTALLVGIAPAVIAAGLARDLRAAAGVTAEALAGVLAIYLLAGMFFSFLFGAVADLGDVRFFEQTADPDRADYLYFSYTTLTTTGYGDFTAATDLGRTLAVAESLIGQIYLVTVVALIITNLRPRWRDGRRAPPAEEEV
jgi:Ion channel